MSVVAAGAGAMAAGQAFANDKSFNSLANLVKAVGSLGDEASPSLTRYANNTVINSSAYIDSSLVDEDVMIAIMSMVNQMYCGFVLTALNLDRFVTDGRRVRELLKAVSSEQYVDVVGMSENLFGSTEQYMDQTVTSMEANVVDMDPASQKLFSGRVIEVKFSAVASMSHSQITKQGGSINQTDEHIEHGGDDTKDGWRSTPSFVEDDQGTMRPVTTTKDIHEEVTKRGYDHKTATQNVGGNTSKQEGMKQQAYEMSVYLYVQILPFIASSDTMKGFVTMNFDPSWSQRWKQWRAGEISFVKDFIFAKDLIQKHKAVIKGDKTGVIADMLAKQRNKLAMHIWSALTDETSRHNLANSIVILNKKSFEQACEEAGVNFAKTTDRTAYFNKTYSMFLIVVDTMYNNVEIYMNGISNVGMYSFNMINKSARGKDAFDLKDIMTVMAQGQAPRF